VSRPVLIRLLVAALVLALLGWLILHTRWEEVEVDDPARGAAAADEYYSLRQVLAGAGATLTVRTSLEPLPPADATLLLESGLWDIFPERDARLKAWVENGGHLVVLGQFGRGESLRWAPLAFAPQHPVKRKARAKPAPPDAVRAEAASAPSGANEDEDEDVPVVGKQLPRMDERQERLARRLLDPKGPGRGCADFRETAATASPAYEPGRVLRGCTAAGVIHALNRVAPSWQLAGPRGTLALRVPVGRGDVTGVAPSLVIANRELLQEDNGLIAAAVLQAQPGRAVWIVEDEAREPLLAWLWHEARTPSLLALAAIALALWRLMVRFGPREAQPPRARRSMGEQVRGTGHFIAGSDPRALHAATRQAFEAVARRRVEGWAELDDSARIEALAASMPHPQAIAPTALQASMNIGGGATPAQVIAAIAVLEQARRALLRAHAGPPPH
jgi:hypothetical protein